MDIHWRKYPDEEPACPEGLTQTDVLAWYAWEPIRCFFRNGNDPESPKGFYGYVLGSSELEKIDVAHWAWINSPPQ